MRAGDGERLGDRLREAGVMGDIDDAHVGPRRLGRQILQIDDEVAVDAIEDDAPAGGAHRLDLDAVVVRRHQDDVACVRGRVLSQCLIVW